MLTSPKLTIINPLPRARVQPSIRNRHRNTRAHKTTLDMRGHIIQPLRIMTVQIPLTILGRQTVERVAHVLAHFLVPVLVERQGAGGVLDEEVENADFVVFQLGELAGHFVRDEVAAAGLGGEGELFLEEGHGCFLGCWLGWFVGVAGCWWAAGAGWEEGFGWWGEWCSQKVEWEG